MTSNTVSQLMKTPVAELRERLHELDAEVGVEGRDYDGMKKQAIAEAIVQLEETIEASENAEDGDPAECGYCGEETDFTVIHDEYGAICPDCAKDLAEQDGDEWEDEESDDEWEDEESDEESEDEWEDDESDDEWEDDESDEDEEEADNESEDEDEEEVDENRDPRLVYSGNGNIVKSKSITKIALAEGENGNRNIDEVAKVVHMIFQEVAPELKMDVPYAKAYLRYSENNDGVVFDAPAPKEKKAKAEKPAKAKKTEKAEKAPAKSKAKTKAKKSSKSDD